MVKKLFDLLIHDLDLQKKVLQEEHFPETVRRKAAVLFIENWFIGNALKRYNQPITVGWLNERPAQLKHGLVEVGNKITFYWFGKKHGPEMTKMFVHTYMPTITWFSLSIHHGISAVPMGTNSFYTRTWDQNTLVSEKSYLKGAFDIPSIAKNGGKTRLAHQIGGVVYRHSLEKGYWK